MEDSATPRGIQGRKNRRPKQMSSDCYLSSCYLSSSWFCVLSQIKLSISTCQQIVRNTIQQEKSFQFKRIIHPQYAKRYLEMSSRYVSMTFPIFHGILLYTFGLLVFPKKSFLCPFHSVPSVLQDLQGQLPLLRSPHRITQGAQGDHVGAREAASCLGSERNLWCPFSAQRI